MAVFFISACSACVPLITIAHQPIQDTPGFSPVSRVYWDPYTCFPTSEPVGGYSELDDTAAAYFLLGVSEKMRVDRDWVRPPSIARGSYRFGNRDFEDWGHTIVEYRPDGTFVWILGARETEVLAGATDRICEPPPGQG